MTTVRTNLATFTSINSLKSITNKMLNPEYDFESTILNGNNSKILV